MISTPEFSEQKLVISVYSTAGAELKCCVLWYAGKGLYSPEFGYMVD